MDWIDRFPERAAIAGDLAKRYRSAGFALSFTCCYPLNNTSDVRRAFLLHQENISIAR